MLLRSGWLHNGSFRFGLAFAVVLALILTVTTVAFARWDEFGGATVRIYAPYTEPYAGTDNIGPHVPGVLLYAPYTEPYAGTDNVGPHVPEAELTPYAPFTEKLPERAGHFPLW